MTFPIIHTNIWDAVIAVPIIMIITQCFKFLPIKRYIIPSIAVTVGLVISVFFSHKDNLYAGIFMGFFYGYAAIGNYASLKTSLRALKKKRQQKQNFL
ncbi:hypothetical protein [Bacillus taeanensis]|uniref:Holin n=1 Tax=Bacillus taeanensis TaxID=273032 RepID=A0A366XTK6_9BACI|nr:hypothetical protein [Bacillus taeanensis]RBW67291.1 hypothetical protein DS031_23005 [Bacillus taeanensis]